MSRGLANKDGAAIIAARADTPFSSMDDLWLRAGVPVSALERLANADAFGSLGLSRRQALWAAKALGRVGAHEDDLPLFRVKPQVLNGDSDPSPPGFMDAHSHLPKQLTAELMMRN